WLYSQAEDGIRDFHVTGVQTCALPISNGKTSVTQYIAQMLKETGTPCGVLGTLGYGMPGHLQPATHTTPDVVQVNRVLSRIHHDGGRAAVMEVSSHALDQGRIDKLTMTGAVFTNLTRDHLDYHGRSEEHTSELQS